MKFKNMLGLVLFCLFSCAQHANATWAPGKEPAHLKANSPGVTQVVEHPDGVRKVWYKHDVNVEKNGEPHTRTETGVQIYDRNGKLVDDIREFHTDNTVTKVDHTTGEPVRVSQVPKFVSAVSDDSDKMDHFRRLTKSKIFEGYQAFRKNLSTSPKNPCPDTMGEELRKGCLTFSAYEGHELSRSPDPTIDPKKMCESGVSAFPKDPFYQAACMGTWLGLQGEKCGMSGLKASHGQLAFYVCRATRAAREAQDCREGLNAVVRDSGNRISIFAQDKEKEIQEPLVLSAREVEHFFLGVCGGLKKVYSAEKLAHHCFEHPKVASHHVEHMSKAVSHIHANLQRGEKENQKNLANESTGRPRSLAEFVKSIPIKMRQLFGSEKSARALLKKAEPGTFLIRRSRDGSQHLLYVDSKRQVVTQELYRPEEGVSGSGGHWMESLEELEIWKNGTLKTMLPAVTK